MIKFLSFLGASKYEVCNYFYQDKKVENCCYIQEALLWWKAILAPLTRRWATARKKGIIPVYSTTERKVAEEHADGEVRTYRSFRHVRYRVYGG
ncbi:MAG: hypothetical protein NUV45_02145 [Tepidanaerobacteraceae bacterium]|jgi:hypothetical protein|nr:hypothetical protein [Tepidanaerobacteraceae bacterium]